MDVASVNYINLFLIFSGVLIFAFLVYASIISYIEKERRVALYFILSGLIIPVPYLYSGLFDSPNQVLLSIILLFLTVMILLIYFIPIKVSKSIIDGEISSPKINYHPEKITKYIKKSKLPSLWMKID